MFALYTSNRTEALAEQLASVICESGGHSPFTKTLFLVQSREMERMLIQFLADRFGVWGSTLLWLGVVFHAFGLTYVGVTRGFGPPTNLGESLGLVGLSTAFIYLYLEWQSRERGLAPFVLVVVLVDVDHRDRQAVAVL